MANKLGKSSINFIFRIYFENLYTNVIRFYTISIRMLYDLYTNVIRLLYECYTILYDCYTNVIRFYTIATNSILYDFYTIQFVYGLPPNRITSYLIRILLYELYTINWKTVPNCYVSWQKTNNDSLIAIIFNVELKELQSNNIIQR